MIHLSPKNTNDSTTLVNINKGRTFQLFKLSKMCLDLISDSYTSVCSLIIHITGKFDTAAINLVLYWSVSVIGIAYRQKKFTYNKKVYKKSLYATYSLQISN